MRARRYAPFPIGARGRRNGYAPAARATYSVATFQPGAPFVGGRPAARIRFRDVGFAAGPEGRFARRRARPSEAGRGSQMPLRASAPRAVARAFLLDKKKGARVCVAPLDFAKYKFSKRRPLIGKLMLI